MGPRAGLEVAENLAPTAIRSPDRPARSQSLYRLSYLAPNRKEGDFKWDRGHIERFLSFNSIDDGEIFCSEITRIIERCFLYQFACLL